MDHFTGRSRRCFWAANLSYHLLDNAILITDYWKVKGSVEWGMVHFKAKPENAEVYAFNSVQGYWGILKGLWPISTLFLIGFLVLIPVATFISNSLTKLQITNANEAQRIAEERARNATAEAGNHKIEMNNWAKEKVKNAQEEANTKAKTEFAKQAIEIKVRDDNLKRREAVISSRSKPPRMLKLQHNKKSLKWSSCTNRNWHVLRQK